MTQRWSSCLRALRNRGVVALSVNANEAIYGVAASSSDGEERKSGKDSYFEFGEINTSFEVGGSVFVCASGSVGVSSFWR